MLNIDMVSAGVVEAVRGHVAPLYAKLEDQEKTIRQLQAAIDDLKNYRPEKGDQGPPGERGPPGESIAGPPGPQGEPGPPGESVKGDKGDRGDDGISIAKTLIDDAGDLIVLLDNGDTKRAGHVKGPQGERGPPGESIKGEKGDKGDPGESIKGDKGDPGKDGLSWEEFDFDLEADGRTLVLIGRQGETIKRQLIGPLPIPYDRGIYKADQKYAKGDGVTYSGCFWIAQQETSKRPGNGSTDWRLSVKCGRDGKDGERGPPGPIGTPGKDGRDLTQIGADGSKW